jgi:branched-chain amino acid transport system substrate-binding protein
MKRVLHLAAALGAALLLFGCSGGAPKEIKIGVVCPISGQSAIAGEYIKNGVSLVSDELEKSGGLEIKGKKMPVKFIIEDNEAKPETTINVYRKFVDQDKVLAIVGPDMSRCILAAGPIAQAAKIPAIGTYTTNEKVTQIGDFIFRACFIDSFQGKVAAKYARETMKADTAAILYNNADEYAKGLMENFKLVFESMGGKIVGLEGYGGSEVKDFNVQLAKIKAGKPDILFLPNLFSEDPLQAKQAREMGIKAKFLGGDSWDTPLLPKIAGKEVIEGADFVSTFSPDNPDPMTQDFVERFKAKFNVAPNSNAVLAYEATKIVLKAIQDADKLTGQSVRDQIAGIKDFKLPSGNVTFGADRNPIKGAVVMSYKNGETVFVTSVNP